MSLESLDDVVFGIGDSADRLVQLKHHEEDKPRPVGDKDVDTWKTLKVWMDAIASLSEGALLYLVTTRVAAPGSGLEAMRVDTTADPAVALERLDAAASGSSNTATATARAQWLALDLEARRNVIERVRVVDGAPSIDDLRDRVRSALRHVLPAEHADLFLDQMWSWWHMTAVGLLRRPGSVVTAASFQQRLSDLRDGFTRASLPSTVLETDLTDLPGHDHAERTFVAQLRWVDTPERQVQVAIIDYFRAYLQVDDWVRNDLLGEQELEKYEERLRTRVMMAHDFMVANLPPSATEEDRRRAGRELLLGALQSTAEQRLRPQFDEDYFARGTHHTLADDGRVGWHPDFEALLLSVIPAPGT